ncbi:hypothetical protein MAR_015110 [Mya arenaria]|uniref:Uncharacterized protein n=1 Tax=Mya arenaria TaxID=6604 RepID=A0ABY7FJQ0_MYAAR|nr:hypothetical protein MAR_015110 [Mya arenaria]
MEVKLMEAGRVVNRAFQRCTSYGNKAGLLSPPRPPVAVLCYQLESASATALQFPSGGLAAGNVHAPRVRVRRRRCGH